MTRTAARQLLFDLGCPVLLCVWCVSTVSAATTKNPAQVAEHSKDGQGSSEGFSEWGPEQEGVRTSLVAREKELSLGKPILLRLEMKNVGSRVVHYDPTQMAINSSMYIEGNDGVEVPSIAPGAQTGVDSRPMNPGERAVLFEALDIASQYLLTAPGSYTVRFRGQDRGFADTPIPPSNAITI